MESNGVFTPDVLRCSAVRHRAVCCVVFCLYCVQHRTATHRIRCERALTVGAVFRIPRHHEQMRGVRRACDKTEGSEYLKLNILGFHLAS